MTHSKTLGTLTLETQEECDADETGAQAPCLARRDVESSGLDDEDCSGEDRDAAAHAPGARHTVEIDEEIAPEHDEFTPDSENTRRGDYIRDREKYDY